MSPARRAPGEADAERVLAIMAKAPRVGHVKTRLAPMLPAQAIVQLYRAFMEDTVAIARRVSADVVIVCPPDDVAEIADWLPADLRIVAQRGAGLADGLASVFELLCDPPRRVVALNADTPHLAPEVLDSAFDALLDHDVVLGPCEDGGYFLVGATRAHDGLFDAQTMGTGTAFDALVGRTRQLDLSSARTAMQYDVDVPADVVRLARELAAWPARAPTTAALLGAWNVV